MQKQSGVTLIELMVIIAIMAVVVALAFPSIDSTMRLNRVQSVTTKLVTSLALARSEAIKSNQRVVLCKSANQATCTTAGFWEQGWIMFRSENGDDVFDAGDDLLLSVSGVLPPNISIRPGRGILNANTFAYRPDGTTGLLLADPENLSFKICSKMSVDFSRQIYVEASGRPRVDTGGVATCLTI